MTRYCFATEPVSMSGASADGERSAVRGFQWQYDHAAALVYDALRAQDLGLVRLADSTAGQVDDLVLVRGGHADAYQLKSSEHPGAITFNDLTRPQRRRGGESASPTIKALAVGWGLLRQRWPAVRVHYVAQLYPSVHDGLPGVDGSSPGHFSAFLTQVLVPLRSGHLDIEDVGAEWEAALDCLREASGLDELDFSAFLSSLYLDLAAGAALPSDLSQRRCDIEELSAALHRRVAEASGVVEMDTQGVLELAGWTARTRLRSRHEFPVDPDIYAPLANAIDEFQAILDARDTGYIAVVGPPGAGKSTLLSQALTGGTDRVVHYYAYVPGRAPLRDAMTARAFLHHIVLMLNSRGLSAVDHLMPSSDTDALRRTLHDHLDAASSEFDGSGRRTIIVVDGLDHVDRDLQDSGLLVELPRPEELPAGVLFVVGSRTLDPLGFDARAQVEHDRCVVDLRGHRLPAATVLEICGRESTVGHLPRQVHERVAELSDGHPLALRYLLNLLHEADEERAVDLLRAAPAYSGEIDVYYRTVWNSLQDDDDIDDIIEILSVVSRLRIGFKPRWLTTWAPDRAVRVFRRRMRHLFREHVDGWRFFHDSFRQFAAEYTALGDDGRFDEAEDAAAHRRAAELCAGAVDHAIAAEELYHRLCAGEHDSVLCLADQATFRAQHRGFRSEGLIRADIEAGLIVAADRVEALVMFELILALFELDARSRALQDVDLPGLLCDVGLVEEALAYCGEARGVPLVHAYGLAARLARSHHSAGRRIFDLTDPGGLGYDDTMSGSSGDEIVVAWARAATSYRPLPRVLASARSIIEHPAIGHRTDETDGLHPFGRWHRYHRVIRALIDTADRHRDEAALDGIAAEIAHQSTRIVDEASQSSQQTSDTTETIRALLADLEIRARSALLNFTETPAEAQRRLDELLASVEGVALLHSTMLDTAETLAEQGRADAAAAFLEPIRYDAAPTLSDLSSGNGPETISHQFRYWRLRHLLASDGYPLPELTPAHRDTPAGSDFSSDAAVHSDTDAIDLADRIGSCVRILARIAAEIDSGRPPPRQEVWTELVRIARSTWRPAGGGSTTLRFVARNNSEVMEIAAEVAISYGADMPHRLADMLQGSFEQQPQQWPLPLRLELAEKLADAGVNVGWHRATLEAMASYASTEDVHERLRSMATVAGGLFRIGQTQDARDIAVGMVPMAFGVGYRKDYQFEYWVAWIGRALAEPGGERFVEDAEYLARLLTAAGSMTERIHSAGTGHLPAAVAQVDPLAAVRIFEYLVRQGAVSHIAALAGLVDALISSHAVTDVSSIDLAADITAEIIAPAADGAFPDLAGSLRATAERVTGTGRAAALAQSVASRTDMYALPTSRSAWRTGLGQPLNTDHGDSANPPSSRSERWAGDDLALRDGRQLTRSEVTPLVASVADILSLRSEESPDSSFPWAEVITEQNITNRDIQTLMQAFADPTPADVEVRACLAESAESSGDHTTALSLAMDVLEHAPDDAWIYGDRASRRRAAAVAVRLGTQAQHVAACRDLARLAVSQPWVPRQLLPELHVILEALAPELDAYDTWPAIRSYLEGMSQTLDLGNTDDLADQGCIWWMAEPFSRPRRPSSQSTPHAALAELAVGHIAHPTTLVRSAAITVVARALRAGNDHVVDALERFSRAATTDDALECAGRCLAAARCDDTFAVPQSLQYLERVLADHPNRAIRDLAAITPPRPYRQLRHAYFLDLPSPDTHLSSEAAIVAPYEPQYRLLAESLGLEFDTLLAMAAEYGSQALRHLPTEAVTRASLRSVSMKHIFVLAEATAARAAYGRVLADLADARMLDGLPAPVQQMLRTVDIDALNRRPTNRPIAVPEPPQAGLDQSVQLWQASTESRIDEYVEAARTTGMALIAATSTLTVLNTYHLEEGLTCGTTVGSEPPADLFVHRCSAILKDLGAPAEPHIPGPGEPLVVENNESLFHQAGANWLAIRPDLAAALGWEPDSDMPGRWYTAEHDPAVESVWWVDGWWGRGSNKFDDTAAKGHAVVLTSAGLADITTVLGAMTTSWRLTRDAQINGGRPAPIEANRTITLI